MSIIVDSLQSVGKWPLAHVFLKLSERTPLRTNLDSSTSVVFVSRIIRVFTAIPHALPNTIKRVVSRWHFNSFPVIGKGIIYHIMEGG